MKTYFVIMFCFCGSILANAQETGKMPTENPKKDKKKYTVRVSYPQYLVTSYEYVEKTETERIFRDSSTKKFRREVKWYVTERILDDSKGEVTMNVNIDSMVYDMYEGNIHYHYNSQSFNGNKLRNNDPDWTMASALLNRLYKLVLNTKGLIKSAGKVDGQNLGDIGQLEEFLDQQSVNMSEKDSALIFLWRKAIRPDQCDHIGNLARGIVPGRMTVEEDSVWKVGTTARINWVNFIDSMDVRLTKASRTRMTIEGVTHSLKPIRENDVILYDVPGLCSILGGKGNGKTTLTLNNKGLLNAMESEKNAEIRIRYNIEEFTEKIKQTISCNMTGRDKW
ncbi:MAG: hypothetical protein ACK5C0_05180 [Candidatus Kapaibacterium sp.]|jgi:hypothetical protein